MLDSLVLGLENTKTTVITVDLCTGHTGTPVFSTPSMIGLMEVTCLESAQEHLGATEVTVGIHVCVSHVAGSQVGEEVTVRSKLVEIERGRFLTFEVSAAVGDRLLGEGTHKRAVLDTTRLKR
ncbi:MAG: thioesterase [Ilumatobacteraceae bacterium]